MYMFVPISQRTSFLDTVPRRPDNVESVTRSTAAIAEAIVDWQSERQKDTMFTDGYKMCMLAEEAVLQVCTLL
jgi:hypothetical protein